MKTQSKTEPITEKNTVPGVAHVKAVATKQFGGKCSGESNPADNHVGSGGE